MVQSSKYITVTAGVLVSGEHDIDIRCELCGKRHVGRTQQEKVEALFQCLKDHIDPKYVFEIYEQSGNKILTNIDREAWMKAKKATKFVAQK